MDKLVQNEWIDNPVIHILLYFESLEGTYFYYAMQIARLLFLLSLIWGGFQLALGTLEARKYVVENVVHLFCFLLILHMFPVFTKGLFKFSNEIAQKISGSSISEAEYTMTNFYKHIEKVAAALINKDSGTWVEQEKKLANDISKLDTEIQNYESLLSSDEAAKTGYANYQGAANALYTKKQTREYKEKKRKLLEYQINNYKKTVSVQGITLNALDSVLVNTKQDERGEISKTNVTNRYQKKLALSVKIKDIEIISPASMMKVMMFCVEILWNKAWSGKGFGEKNLWEKITTDYPRKTMEIVITLILCIFSIVMVSCILIQYIMGVIEYVITSGISLLIVPCLLFDGLKDMVNKILPSLLAQAMKLIMINLCMFFALSQFLRLAVKALTIENGASLQSAAYIIFSLLLTFALSVNAPKIAATLMTGSPQMSMGEFVQAAAAAAGGAMMAGKAINTAQRAVDTGSKWAANRIMDSANRIGDFSAMHAAGKEASSLARANGSNGFMADLKGMGAGLREGGYIAKTRLAKGFSDWAHSGSGGGHGGRGGGASGESKFSYGIDAAKLNSGDKSDKLNKHAINFGDAMNYDPKNGEATTRQTMGEYTANRAEDARNRVRQYYTPRKRNVTSKTNEIVPVSAYYDGGSPGMRDVTPPGLVPTKRKNKIAPNRDE